MKSVISGKVFVVGDDISVYDIIPTNRQTHDGMNPEVLGKWALEDADPAFKNQEWALKSTGATIIVAGKNFGGGGKSIEHPIFALLGAGIEAVVADSFARYNFRNSVNNALPVIVCEGIRKLVETGDTLTINLIEGKIINERTQETLTFVPFSDFVLELLEAGGLIEHTKREINKRK